MPAREHRRTSAPAILVTTVLLWLHAATLLRYPPPFVDEAWAASRSWALITQGIAFGVLDAGVFERYPGYWTYFPMLPTLLQAIPLWLVGHPALWPLRVMALAFGLVLLRACYVLGRSFGGRAAGLLGCALVGLSPAFFHSAHLARWDIIVAALGYAALAIQVSNDARRPARAAVAGLCIGLAFEVHPNAVMYIPTALGLFLLESRAQAFRRRDVWAWAGGLAGGACVYAALHLVRFPATFVALAALGHGPTHTPPLLTLDMAVMARGAVDAVRLILFRDPLWSVAVVVAATFVVLWSVRSPSPVRHVPLFMAGVLLGAFALLVRNKLGYYTIHVTPAFDLVIALFLGRLAGMSDSRSRERLAGVLTVACLGVTMGLNVSTLRSDGSRVFADVLTRVVSVVEPRDVVMGTQTYWLGLSDHRYYSWEQLVYYKRHAPTSTLQDGLREFRPDIFILDGHLEQFLQDTPDTRLYSGHLDISRQELLRVLSGQARLVTDFEGGVYGRVRVYRIRW